MIIIKNMIGAWIMDSSAPAYDCHVPGSVCCVQLAGLEAGHEALDSFIVAVPGFSQKSTQTP